VTAWQVRVVRKLLEAGNQGIMQGPLVHAADPDVSAEDLIRFLESLRAEHAVQKFTERHATIWRATNILPSVV